MTLRFVSAAIRLWHLEQERLMAIRRTNETFEESESTRLSFEITPTTLSKPELQALFSKWQAECVAKLAAIDAEIEALIRQHDDPQL